MDRPARPWPCPLHGNGKAVANGHANIHISVICENPQISLIFLRELAISLRKIRILYREIEMSFRILSIFCITRQ